MDETIGHAVYESDPHNSHVSPIYSAESPAEDFPEPKRRRIEESADLVNSNEVNRFRDDLLGVLDDSDVGSDLDSVVKSFEEEITVPEQQSESSILDLSPGASLNELGYLLEASDDELGLPPSFTNSLDEKPNPEVLYLPEISSSAVSMPFVEEMPNYDSFDLGPEININIGCKEAGNDDFVMLGGLFDFTENCDVQEVIWRPESLPAV